MSQLFQMCKAIVNYPKSEMTVDDVIESMNGTGLNPHSIRCALSKIASNGVLVESTSKHRGRVKVYRKRNDINAQWDWMMAHKSPTNRLVMPNSATALRSRKKPVQKQIEKKDSRQPSGSRQSEVISSKGIFNELVNIGKALGSIEAAIRENTRALQDLKIDRPTVVVRRQKA